MSQWQDRRTEWIEARWIHLHRIASRGLLASFEWRITIEEVGTGCVVRHEVGMTPSGLFSFAVLRLLKLPELDRCLADARRNLATWSRGQLDHPFPRPKTPQAREQETLTDQAMRADGSEYGHGQVSRLVQWMSDAQRTDLLPIRPTDVALAWNQNVDDVAEILLAAWAVGLLKIHWASHCSSCGSLSLHSELPALQVRCKACGRTQVRDLSKNVELVFTVASLSDDVARNTLPIGLVRPCARLSIGPGKKLSTRWQGPVGTVRIFVRETGLEHSVRMSNADIGIAITTAGGQLSAAQTPSQPGIIEISNRDDEVRTVEIFHSERQTPLYSAKRALLLQAYRDLKKETARQTERMVVLHDVAVLVTDLAGQARRYQKTGAPEAFKAASKRLQNITESARSCGGSVYGRVGERIVMLFPDVVSAFAAARQIAALPADDDALPFVGAIALGDAELAEKRGKTTALRSPVEQAMKLVARLGRGELALGDGAADHPSLAKRIVGYEIGPAKPSGYKIRFAAERPTKGSDDQSVSAA